MTEITDVLGRLKMGRDELFRSPEAAARSRWEGKRSITLSLPGNKENRTEVTHEHFNVNFRFGYLSKLRGRFTWSVDVSFEVR